MTDESTGQAPDIGEPTDAAVGEETAVFLMSGGRPAGEPPGAADGERTMDTPDELGGTGGEQAGGAG